MRLFVNRSKVEQSVTTPSRNTLWLKPGEGVEGEFYAPYAGPKSLKEEKPGAIERKHIKASDDHPQASAFAQMLVADPKFAEAVQKELAARPAPAVKPPAAPSK